MIHDVILALGGIGGEVLKILLDDKMLANSLSIHPCEKSILKELTNIADSYKNIYGFIKKVPNFGEETIVLDDGSEIMPGMYLRAFCNGLYDSLEPYRKNLIKIERAFLENPEFTLSGILAEVSSFTSLLATLNSIINQIVTRKLHGCKILQLLHQYLSTGIEITDEAMARIMQRCHLVMLKQLTSWLLYGHLIDPFSEFFIEPCLSSRNGLETSMSTLTLDSESLPENVMRESSLPEYRIIQDMVPSYIPPSFPEKAKFIGSTVVLFSRDPRERKPGVDIKLHDSMRSKMESCLLGQLKSLQNSVVLDVAALESVVDSVRTCVTQHLFSLAKDEANLMGELKLIKEFYLLGHGELFVNFLRKASNTLLKPVSLCLNSGRDLTNHLYASVRNMQCHSDTIMEKFSFKVPPRDTVPSGSTVWSMMTLEYRPPWPLHLLFTPTVLSTYNTLFSFLLQVKIAELNLHNVWIENVKRKDNPQRQEVWTVRNCMMFLVHSLQCYLHLDVLESEYSILTAALEKTEDFEQVIHHHSLFLTHITAQAFLLSKEVHNSDQPPTTKRHPVNKCLIDILKLCDNFCSEVSKTEISEDSLKTIKEELDMNIAMLMNLITLLGNKASGLRLLLLRLDYNRYFSGKSI